MKRRQRNRNEKHNDEIDSRGRRPDRRFFVHGSGAMPLRLHLRQPRVANAPEGTGTGPVLLLQQPGRHVPGLDADVLPGNDDVQRQHLRGDLLDPIQRQRRVGSGHGGRDHFERELLYQAELLDPLARIDDAAGGCVLQISQGGDLPVLHGDIGAEPRVAAAVDHTRVADQDVVVGSRCEERQEKDD
jgi:hypothetical protein